MSYDWNDDIADRAADEMAATITTARDASAYSIELTALGEVMRDPLKRALPVSDFGDLQDGVFVSLLPSLDGMETKETREYTRHEYAVGLCVEARCGREDHVRQALLMDLSQRLANTFKPVALATGLTTVPGKWQRTQIMQRIDRDRLRQHDVFLSFRHVVFVGRAK